jgi:hypothetical protein
VIENRGPGDARNISFSLDLEDGAESPIVEDDYKRKLPVSILRSGDRIRVNAQLTYDTGTHFEGKWTWEDEDGRTYEREGPISL